MSMGINELQKSTVAIHGSRWGRGNGSGVEADSRLAELFWGSSVWRGNALPRETKQVQQSKYTPWL